MMFQRHWALPGRATAVLLATFTLSAATDIKCGQCHRQQTANFHTTPMARALETVAACDILKAHSKLTFQEGPYSTEITRDGDRSILTVTQGDQKFSTPLLWAFGRGQAGQTYVFERDGAFYESRVSFYNALVALDLTMGAQRSQAARLSTRPPAAGWTTSARASASAAIRRARVAGGKLHLESMSPGRRLRIVPWVRQRNIVAAVRGGNAAAAKIRQTLQRYARRRCRNSAGAATARGRRSR